MGRLERRRVTGISPWLFLKAGQGNKNCSYTLPEKGDSRQGPSKALKEKLVRTLPCPCPLQNVLLICSVHQIAPQMVAVSLQESH